MNKRVFILQGISGSGKSTWARAQKSRNAEATGIVSADDFFINNGRYAFDPTKIGEAHRWCLRLFAHHVHNNSFTHVIVDNTNTTPIEVAPYIGLAEAYDYKVTILRFEAAITEALKRNVHSVPEKAISFQWADLQAFSRLAPPWWPMFEVYRG